jgi:hypothetical protein
MRVSRPLNRLLEHTANCCEDSVSILLLTEIFAAGSFLSAGCCCLLEVAMVAEIRRGLAGWETPYLQRDIVVTLRSHRRFYPSSPLRTAFVASSFVLACCIAGLVAVHRTVHGL